MLSLIICSKQYTISEECKSNIDNTIGKIPYEIICIDNSKKDFSIFQAYNYAIKKAQYPFICFMHEDILYHTTNWGELIINKLNNKKIGLLGVMGAHYIDQYSQYYHVPGICRGKVIQGEYKNGIYIKKIDERYQYKQLGCNVIVIDGLWIASRKELFDKGILHWDEDTYKGFHFYDMDLCMQANIKGLKIQIVDELLIEHKSIGKLDLEFYNNSIIFHKKWNSYLPIMSTNIPSDILNKVFIEQIENKKNIWKEQQSYNKILNKTPYKILTKLLLMLGFKLYE